MRPRRRRLLGIRPRRPVHNPVHLPHQTRPRLVPPVTRDYFTIPDGLRTNRPDPATQEARLEPAHPGILFTYSEPLCQDLNTASNSSVDYKKLYEAEKSATAELRAAIASAQSELRELQEQVEATQRKRRSSDAEQRKLERKISECDEELKTLDKLRSESERLRAEHRALVRVVSRLNREQ
ncbi:unnamed protein product [Echinostoma caproni]|uniref:PRKG1_interact domain-containing protein n=1 Tax=Echinostoma caproni TaxID=27848 RepID=A0A183AAI8_9TREM|nr:unnamed protein product [Echinostoma caproni]